MVRYSYGNLTLRSDAVLPLPRAASAPQPTDIDISFGPLPPRPTCIRSRPHFKMYADGTSTLCSPQGVSFLFGPDRSLRIDCPRDVPPQNVWGWFLGPGLGLLLHYHSHPPLHASAVAINGQTLVIAGNSGVGKSTTTRALLRQGHHLLNDDQTVIDPSTRLVYPGTPGLRLWRETALLFGDPIIPETQVTSGEDKYAITFQDHFEAAPRPLAAIVLLSPDHSDTLHAERVEPRLAAGLLHAQIYRVRLATFMQRSPNIFTWTTSIAATTPVYQFHRPRDLARLPDIATYLERLTGGTS